MLHDCREELRKADLKVTPARLGVLKALENTKTPLDTLSVINYLKEHGVKADKTSVFRIINLFTKKGLAKKIQFQEGKFRYELASGDDHHHFICENCERVEDIVVCNVSELEKDMRKRGISVKRHSLEFFGFCKQCQF